MRFFMFSIAGGNSLMSDSVSSATVPADQGKKLAGNGILWLFAIGQLGWSMLSGIISNWLVYYYQPGESLLSQGQQLFITQGAVFVGLTVIGLITASGRIFDAFTDPWIASKSDRCRHRLGRRVPFLRFAPIPFGAATVLIFISPVGEVSWVNNLFLLVMVLCFYLAMTCYCTPYNALIPELGRTQKQRINVSTFISTTYFFGTAFAYLVPNIAAVFAPDFGITTCVGWFGVPGVAWGVIVAVLASIPMAILGIIPQAVVADIAEADAIQTGEKREGMFYAARTFAFKLGQSLAMLLFTSIALIGSGGMGYRLTAVFAAVFCLLGAIVFTRYHEDKIMGIISENFRERTNR